MSEMSDEELAEQYARDTCDGFEFAKAWDEVREIYLTAIRKGRELEAAKAQGLVDALEWYQRVLPDDAHMATRALAKYRGKS